MADIVTLETRATRCRECRHASDCPLLEAGGEPGEAVLHSRVKVLHQGDRLFREGDDVDAVYRVRTGVVKTHLTDADGGEQVTGFFGAGEWVGLESLENDRYRCEAAALDTVSVCVIPASLLAERFESSPRAARLVIQAQSRRLSAQNGMHMSLARDNAAQRLAAFLLDLSTRRAEASLDPEDIALPMSRAEIASYLALAVETVSRLLTRMHKAGTLCVYRSHVRITDRAALAQLCARAPQKGPCRKGSSVRA